MQAGGCETRAPHKNLTKATPICPISTLSYAALRRIDAKRSFLFISYNKSKKI
jgi:hypothetical protein